MSDPRFAKLKTDPRFRPLKKHKSKVTVDDRFKSVFDKGKQKKKGRVDKYGRPVSDTHDRDALHRFYRLEDDSDEENDATKPTVADYARGGVLLESSDEEENDEEEDDGVVTVGHDSTKPITIPLDEDAEIDLDEDTFAELDAQAAAYSKKADEDEDKPEPAEKTRRIAVVNLDWDHVRAVHLYKIFSSLLASNTPSLATSSKKSKKSHVVHGKVLHVKVYPSQFGKERIAREEKEGPPPELFKQSQNVNPDDINEKNIYEVDNEEYDEEALRKYQVERLRYYYAIATCDTVQAASHVFSELEGTELERSANVFDLSFVPEDMTFDDEPRDEADESATSNYKGLDFSTDALRHSKVKLTWDDDDHERYAVTRRALTKKEIEEDDFRAYIASSSDEDDDEQAAESTSKDVKRAQERDRLRALLVGNHDEDLPEGWGDEDGNPDDVDMQITFSSGLNKTEDHDETTLEKYQRKLKQKKQKRKDRAKEPAEEEEADDVLQDDFFAADSGEEASPPKKASKKEKKKGTKTSEAEPAPRKDATKEELALLVTGDTAETGPQHFDLSAVIKAEKSKSKRKKNKKSAVPSDELQEDFVIDTADNRFAAIHQDHSYAIDPSNPSFKKTKAMSALLSQPFSNKKRADEVIVPTSGEESKSRPLDKLVESVKRKSTTNSSHQERKGKRSRLA